METAPLLPADRLKDLIQLSPSVWLRPPTTSPDTQAPQFVVLCGWLQAPLRHVSKYAQGYNSILPSSTVLIVQSSMLDALTPWTSDRHRRRLKPVVDMIKKSATGITSTSSTSSSSSSMSSEDRPSLIVQPFSGAGIGTAWLLLTYLSELSLLNPLLTGLVLDSCPGTGGYLSTVNAFRVASNSHLMSTFSPVRISIEVAAHIGVAIIHSLIPFLAGTRRNVTELAGLGTNDPKLVGLEVPRVYFYSMADLIFPHDEITMHVEEAKRTGYRFVKEVAFTDTGHCGHMTSDPERYWAAVLEMSQLGVSARL